MGQNQDVSSMKCIMNEINQESNDFTLFIFSHTNCGPCHIAKKDMKEIAEDLNIIFIEYGDNLKYDKIKDKYKKFYDFVRPEICASLKEIPDFFPKLYLMNSAKKIVWRSKGWKGSSLTKLKRKVKP